MLITLIILLLVLALLDLQRWTAARHTKPRPRTIEYHQKATDPSGSLR